jgi:hypothetical protein
VIAKGKSNRCHKQFGRQDAHCFDIWHFPSGWSTEILIWQCLDCLREQFPPEPLYLLRDQYGTQTTEQMNRKAEVLGIEFIFVPKEAVRSLSSLTSEYSGYWNQKGEQSGNMSSRNITENHVREKSARNSCCSHGLNCPIHLW